MESDIEMLRLYQPPVTGSHCQDDGRCEDMLLTFLYCIGIPAVLVAIFLVILTSIMCCSRKACTCKKYSSLTTENNCNDIQMESYNTIRTASASLRHMSQNRETPVEGSRSGSMTLDRSYRRTRRGRESCSSAPGTLQRQHRNRHSDLVEQAPPPPAYSMHSDDLFYGSEYLTGAGEMQTSVHYEDSPDRNGSGAQPLLYQHRYQ